MVHPNVQATAVGGICAIAASHLLGRAMVKSSQRFGIETLRDARRNGFQAEMQPSRPPRVKLVKRKLCWTHHVRRFFVGADAVEAEEITEDITDEKKP